MPKPQLAIAAARAWAMAEAEGLILKSGEKLSDFRKAHLSVEPILEPAKHFALMFGVSPDYADMAHAVQAYSGTLADRIIPPAGGCSMTIFLTLSIFTGGTLFGAVVMACFVAAGRADAERVTTRC
jgi:hypothetical protein